MVVSGVSSGFSGPLGCKVPGQQHRWRVRLPHSTRPVAPCFSAGQQGPSIEADPQETASRNKQERRQEQRQAHRDGSDEASTSGRESTAADRLLQGLSQEQVAKRTTMLLDIATAGEKVEEAIARHAGEIDFATVRLLEKRVEIAFKMGESRAGLEGLILLLKRIRLVAERNAASPAERLLDDALRLLQLSTGLADAQDYEEEVKYRLQAAFQLPGHTDSGPVDVFAAAALLAAEEELGEDGGAEDEEVERVSQAEFLHLAESMLARARAQQRTAQQALQAGSVAQDAALHTAREGQLLVQHLEQILELARQ